MDILGARAALAALLIVGVALLAAPSLQPTRAQAEVVTVDIVDFAFIPDAITIPVGTTVEWVNRGVAVHTTTSDTSVWDSGPLPGRGVGRFRFTFTEPGTYAYHCEPHPWMTARIIVEGAPATPTPSPSPTATPRPTPTTGPVATPGTVASRIFLPAVFRMARP